MDRSHQSDTSPLPPDWFEFTGPTGLKFWYNSNSRASTYAKPKAPSNASAAAGAAPGGAPMSTRASVSASPSAGGGSGVVPTTPGGSTIPIAGGRRVSMAQLASMGLKR